MKEALKMDNKRKWVIRFAVIFLIVIALLTFFSQTIMNYSLTKVTAQYPEYLNIATSTRASGILEPMAYIEVKAIDHRKISEVHFNDLDEVRSGDLLYSLELIESSEELEMMKAELESIELERYYESLLPNHGPDYTMYEESIEYARLAVDRAKTDLSNARNKSSIIQSAQSDVNSAQTLLITLEADRDALVQAKANFEFELQIALEALDAVPDGDDNSFELAEIERISNAIESLDNKIQTNAADEYNAQTRLENATMKLLEAQEYMSVQDAERELSRAERELMLARRALSDQVALDNVDAQRAQRARQEEDERIANLKQDIAELEVLMEVNEIRAPISGRCSGFHLSVGDEIYKDQVLGSILNPSAGFKAEFVFTREQVRFLYPGQFLNSSDYNVYEVMVMDIRTNPDSPRDSVILTASIAGENLYAGHEVSIWFDDYNQRHEAVLPNSAIHQDDTGLFVYVLQIKDGPLGKRFFAQKTPVTILATDGRRSAVEPEQIRGRQIIMRSEKPLTNGEQVRLEDFTPEG